MFGYCVNDQFHCAKGGIETILFMNEDHVALSNNESSDKPRFVSRQQFEDLLESEDFIKKEVECPHIPLTEYQQEFANDKLRYLQILFELVKQGHKATVFSTYELLISLVEKKHPETQISEHPSWKTVCKYWKQWRSAEFKEDVLACKKRLGRTRLNSATEAFIKHHVDTVFSDSNSDVKVKFYEDYKKEAKEASCSNGEIKVASRRTYYRRLNELLEQEVILNKKHLSEAERNQRLITLQRSIKTYFALQRVECDRIQLNMCLIDDDTGKPTPPISLYIAIDVYSRCIIAMSLSFHAECKEAGLHFLRQLYLSDQNLPMQGKADVLIMDNGNAFNNDLVQKAGERLGLSIKYTPSNQPSKKPFIESFNKSLRNDFFRGFCITTKDGKKTIGFNSYAGKRDDKNSLKLEKLENMADIYVSDFKYMLNVFLTERHHKVNESWGFAPIERWNDSLINTPRPRVPYFAVQNRFHVVLDTYGNNDNKLQSNGRVRTLGQDFASEESKTLFNTLNTLANRGENPRVKVYYDPWDARQVTIVVITTSSRSPIEVIAYNTSLLDVDTPISFDELKGVKSKCEDIWHPLSHTPKGHYAATIDSFVKRSRRGSPRGKRIPSFNENNEKGLSSDERITLAHSVDSKKYADRTANPTTRKDYLNNEIKCDNPEEPVSGIDHDIDTGFEEDAW